MSWYIECTPCMYYLGYVLIPPTLDSLIWHDFQHLFHFWQIEYWVTEDSCKVEYLDLADLHHGIEPNLKEKSCFFKYCFSSFVGKMDLTAVFLLHTLIWQ